MSGASVKHAWLVWVACLGLAACGRVGFQEHALTPASMIDAGAASSDAGAPDADGADSGLADAGTDGAPNDAAVSCKPVSSDDYCAALPHLDHLPVIDGQAECELNVRPFTPQGWVGSIPTIPSDQG